MKSARTSVATAAPSVLHVVLGLSPGGTERLVIELSKRMRTPVRGVLCLDSLGEWSAELASRGIPVRSLAREAGFHPSVGFRVAQAARRAGATILHCHHYSPFVYGRLATLVAPHLRLVFTEHGRLSDEAPSRKRRLVNPLLSRFRGTIHAVSHDLRQHMIESGFRADRIGVIHNGIDLGCAVEAADVLRARARLGLPVGATVVGTVARLDSVKDLATLLRAAALLAPRWPTLRMVVVGDGPERRALEELRRELGLEHMVLFAGHHDDARTLVPAFDVFVNSSISEGISLTLLEAMAASRPTVATRVGGTPEVVEHETTGLLVPARSPKELADSVGRLLCSPAPRVLMGHAGRKRVERLFSIDRMVADYDAIYQQLSN